MPHSFGRKGRLAVVAALALLATLSPAAVGRAEVAAAPTSITFPVQGGARWSDTWGACRGSRCSRRHQGQDLFARKHTPLIAVVDGTVDKVINDHGGTAGNMVSITDASGWRYLYLHLNNDTIGTDDGRGDELIRFAPGIRPGRNVLAGQVVGYLGDSGNAETTPPHLHFEIRNPDNIPVNASRLLRGAVRSVLAPSYFGAHAPFGNLDLVTIGPGGVHVAGWAADRDREASLPVDIYVDGRFARTIFGNSSRPDAAAASGRTDPRMGFADNAATREGTVRVCVFAADADRGPSTALGCRPVAVSGQPLGAFDRVTDLGAVVVVEGWALDPDTFAALDVTATIGGEQRTGPADIARSDVGAAYPAFGPNRGFRIIVPSLGATEVCVRTANVGRGAPRSLGCRAL